MKRSDLIINDIKAGDVIVGFASHGQAIYEKEYNGGMGSNGLTSARHDVLHKVYSERYPDSYDPNTPEEVIYTGSKKLTQTTSVEGVDIPVGKLILSPTRTYMPLLQELFKTHRSKINGLIHCTGGGQTKVSKFVENKKIIKSNLLPLPPLFKLIQEESGTSWKEMYQVFNMGHRLEVYLSEKEVPHVLAIAKAFGIDAQVIGRVEEAETTEVVIDSPFGLFKYK